jgi:hypothetical protein
MQRLLKDLKGLVAREKAKPTYDHDLVKDLEELAKSYEKQVKPITLADLPEADRKRLEDEARKKVEEEFKQRGPGGGGADWQARSVERALEGVDLPEAKRAKVSELLGEFTKEVMVAYQNQDFKLIGDLKKDLEKQLTREVGRNRAKDIMNNVNKMGGGRGRW